MKILMITPEWPTSKRPYNVPFLVNRVNGLRRLGVEVKVFHFQGRKNPINYLKAWFDVRKIYRSEIFDLVHAQFGQSGLVALPSPFPLVTTFRGSDLHGIVGDNESYTFIGKISRLICGYVSRHSKKNIVVSQHLERYLPANIQLDVVSSGVDLKIFCPINQDQSRKKIKWSLHKKIVLFASDPNRLVKRFRLAQETMTIVKKELNVEMKVVYNKSHKTMPLYLNASDVLLLTSKHEGSPTIVREALVCGLPVVSVDVGDVCQQIDGIKGCAVCNSDSPEALAKALVKVLKSERNIGLVSREAMDEEMKIDKIIEIYKKVSGT